MPSSSSSIYSYRPGGSLKFKGGESLPMKKKKKSKSKSSTSKDIRTKDDYRSSSKDKDIGTLSKHEEEDDDVEEEQLKSGKIMTEAEKKFEEIKRKRMADRVAKEAGLSHKDRVDQFNKSLAERTEHNDMLTVAGH